MKSFPLFHRLTGQTVAVLGEGAMAIPKRRLIERAGGIVVTDLGAAIEQGARLAFIAHVDAGLCEADAKIARDAGLLVNVVDRPDLCDFTTPSILERDPVIIAIGTSGASAGLAKQLRLRLEGILPQNLGALAARLSEMRGRIKEKWPDMTQRRQMLDAALTSGGALDPLREDSADGIEDWLSGGGVEAASGQVEITLTSDDPEDLTLRQARLLGSADALLHDPQVPAAILNRARADALRYPLPHEGRELSGLVLIICM